MADFCKVCSDLMFGFDVPNDFENLCKPGEMIQVLCEGCGWIWVDHTGKRIDW
jgi:RNase P subunit RPR2